MTAFRPRTKMLVLWLNATGEWMYCRMAAEMEASAAPAPAPAPVE